MSFSFLLQASRQSAIEIVLEVAHESAQTGASVQNLACFKEEHQQQRCTLESRADGAMASDNLRFIEPRMLPVGMDRLFIQ